MAMKQIRVADATGPVLDWLVLTLETHEDAAWYLEDGVLMEEHGEASAPFCPSTNWARGGPIIEREKFDLVWDTGRGEEWTCFANDSDDANNSIVTTGPTPLIAAMRCYCCSKLGDEVDIPEELCQQQSS